MPDLPTLKCADCGHENEPERVYCHNCGSKLDRSLLPKAEERKNFERPEDTRRRVSRMMNVRPNWVARDFKALIKVLIFAAVVAALVLFWWPPENAPAASNDPSDFAARDEWQRQMESPAASSWTYTDKSINMFLKTLKAGESSFIKYEGASVKFSPGLITVLAKRDVGGAPMWSSIDYRPVTAPDGKFRFQVVGVHYGRLGIDPSMTFAQGWGVGPVLKVLEKDFKIDRISSVIVEEGKATVITR